MHEVVVAAMLAQSLIPLRNELITERESVTDAWSRVESQMKRRASLIPDLVETVKRFAKENYPALQSDPYFETLLNELAGTENNMTRGRRTYNGTLQRYDSALDRFPKNIAASVFGFQRNESYFKAEAGVADVPKVNF